jgi:DegV family protein with EDD domain
MRSSKISGSLNSAALAGNMLETDRISVVDSKMSGFGQASLAIRAKELADQGADRAEIVKALEDQQSRTRTYFIVNSLRYLHEGGRLSGIEALVGSIIQIKPIVWFTNDGTMAAFEKVRTLNGAKARLLELVKEQAAAGFEKIGLHYGDNIEEAKEYGKSLEEVTGMPVQLVKLSPVISAHTGPDVLGLCFITKR